MEGAPASIEVRYNLANSLLDAGNMEEARTQFEQILVIAASRPRLGKNDKAFVEDARETLLDLTTPKFRQLPFLANRPLPPALQPANSGVSLAEPQLPRRVEKVGRNDPCPCGSGKKYKRCHGR